MHIIPLELKELNAIVKALHRHHKEVQGHKFSIGVCVNGKIVGGCSVGRPVSRMADTRKILEVTRLVTDGTKNACSMLYSAAARAAKELGYEHIQTFILDTETGISLKAAGWYFEKNTSGGCWAKSRPDRRVDQPMGPKQRWGKKLR